MGLIDRFERGIERVVNGAFAKAFRSEVQPVELASALRREADNQAAVVDRGRTLVPNAYSIRLSPSDYERVADWEDTLGEELASALNDHARQQGYSFVGPVGVNFEQDNGLGTGVFRVHGTRVKGAVAAQSAAPAPGNRHPVVTVNGRRYQLNTTSTVIGRGGEADIVVDDPGISRRHAEILITPTGSMVRDLGSTNGTFVDGERATSAQLFDGSTVTLGRTRVVFSTGRADG